jgi:hypothetical protein
VGLAGAVSPHLTAPQAFFFVGGRVSLPLIQRVFKPKQTSILALGGGPLGIVYLRRPRTYLRNDGATNQSDLCSFPSYKYP